MAAPDLTQRMLIAVQKNGTDDAGANAVGAPQSRLTINAALADLAANYPAASSTFFHTLAVGPGVYLENAIALPPWTFIEGACDAEGRPTAIISLADSNADITLAAGWAANATARGAIRNVQIRAASGTPTLDETFPVPVAGNPSRTLELHNVVHNLTTEVFEANSTGDVVIRSGFTQDGVNTDTFIQTGGASKFNNVVSAAAITIKDKTSFAASGVWQGVVTGAGAGITAQSVAAAGCTLRMTASNPRTLTISETAPGVITVQADAVSIPVRASVSYTGTAAATDLALLNDAAGEAFTPTTPANWSPVPTTVQGALDTLAAAGFAGSFVQITRTGDRSVAAWGTAGVAINDTANTFTDTTSAGAVAGVTATRSFGIPTISNATAVYADLTNLYIAGPPALAGGATATNVWSLYIAAGNARLTSGALYFGAATPGRISGAAGALAFFTAAANANFTAETTGTGVFQMITTDAAGSSPMNTLNRSAAGSGVFTGYSAYTGAGDTLAFNLGHQNSAIFGGSTVAGVVIAARISNQPVQVMVNQGGTLRLAAVFDAVTLNFGALADINCISGGVTTANPTVGTAAKWKMGAYTAGAALQGGTVRVNIGGTDRDLLAV